MMWLEFLFDRIGGPELFQAAFEGEKNAWSHPDALRALKTVRELVQEDAFGKGFASVTVDSNADQALLYNDQAAMMLHGSWSYGSQQADGGDFVSSGGLGYMNFPPVDGGKDDPSDTVGNPGQYLSISSKASAEQKETAKKFVRPPDRQRRQGLRPVLGPGAEPDRRRRPCWTTSAGCSCWTPRRRSSPRPSTR
jgi:raffinose/stachyose/melibiose transport system substrate-binding protein